MTREQMLSDLARAIIELKEVKSWSGIMRLSNRLLDLGYRKQSEGEWVPVSCEPYGNGLSERTWYKCSSCGKYALGWCDDEYYADPQMTEYCPHCGARMKGE